MLENSHRLAARYAADRKESNEQRFGTEVLADPPASPAAQERVSSATGEGMAVTCGCATT